MSKTNAELLPPEKATTVKAAARLIGVSRDMVYKYIRAGLLTSYAPEHGRPIYLDIREVQKMAESRSKLMRRTPNLSLANDKRTVMA